MEKRLPKYVLLALALSWGGSALAQTQQEPSGDGIWTLEEAVTYATAHNLQVQQSTINRSLAKADLKQSQFNRLPSINGSASHYYNYGTNRDPLTGDFLNAQRIRSNNFSASASVPLFMGFQQINAIKQNVLDLQATEQDVLSAQNDITIQIVTSYLNILFADELIKTSTLQRDLTKQQLERNRILFEAGSVAENSVLELESQLASDELALINAQNQRDIARLSLMQLLNLPTSENFQIEVPQIPEPDQSPILVNGNQVYDIAEQNLPAIKAADLRVLSAAKSIEVARGAYYPTLNFGAGINTGYSSSVVRYDDNPLTTIRGYEEQTFYSDNLGTEPLAPVYVPIVSTSYSKLDYSFLDQLKDNIGKQLGFSLQVPIFNGFQVRTNVQRAKISQQNAKLNADIARSNLRQTIEQAYVDAVAAQRKYVAAKQQLVAAEKNYRNAELRLNSGVINTVDFNVISNTFRSAQSNLLQAKYEFTFKQKVLDFYQGKDISF